MVAIRASSQSSSKIGETFDGVVLEEVPPKSVQLAELCDAILTIQQAQKRLLQIPEPQHAHYDVFPGGTVIYSHSLGGCALCR